MMWMPIDTMIKLRVPVSDCYILCTSPGLLLFIACDINSRPISFAIKLHML